MNSNNHNNHSKSNTRFGHKPGAKDAPHGGNKNKVVAPAKQQKQEAPKATKPTEHPEN